MVVVIEGETIRVLETPQWTLCGGHGGEYATCRPATEPASKNAGDQQLYNMTKEALTEKF